METATIYQPSPCRPNGRYPNRGTVLLLSGENDFDPPGKRLSEIPEKISRGVVGQVSARVEQLVGSSDVGLRLERGRGCTIQLLSSDRTLRPKGNPS